MIFNALAPIKVKGKAVAEVLQMLYTLDSGT